MPYDETTVERIRRILSRRRGVVEKKMIGGLSFMVSGKLCCGVNRVGILIRIDPEMRDEMLAQPYVRPMKLSRRTISSFVRVEPEGYRTDAALAKWVRMGVSFALAASRRKA
jgi:hypothetical protein